MYRTAIIRKCISSHRRSTRVAGDISLNLNNDSIQTLTEDLGRDTIKCTDTGLDIEDHQSPFTLNTWSHPYQASELAEAKITKSIKEGTAIAVSDRLFKNIWGTYALIIEGDNGTQRRISASRTTPFNSEDQEDYRSELSEILHIIMIIEQLCEKFAITEGAVIATYEGLDTIRMTMDHNTSFSIKYNHFDILSAIDSEIQRSTIQWN